MTRELAPADWKLSGDEPKTAKQHRMLCAVCGDLAPQIVWHGLRMSKDSWRHFLSGVALGQVMVPSYDDGSGNRGFVFITRSSNELSRSACSQAIAMGIHIGDEPAAQGIAQPRVRWSRTVLFGMGYSPSDVEELAA